MLHPRVEGNIFSTDLAEYCTRQVSINKVLEECKVLITDFSSIAYDAFYRGSNVIFWWKGKSNHLGRYKVNDLMLREEFIFGDIVYNRFELANILERCYNSKQRGEFSKVYRGIVRFSDGRNTERLIEFLERDGWLY